jgi:hypothetical protein
VHASDWYLTIANGLGKLNVLTDTSTGPIPPDSIDQWEAIMGGGTVPDPRTEVLHFPLSNQYVNVSIGKCQPVPQGHGCSPSLRMGE